MVFLFTEGYGLNLILGTLTMDFNPTQKSEIKVYLNKKGAFNLSMAMKWNVLMLDSIKLNQKSRPPASRIWKRNLFFITLYMHYLYTNRTSFDTLHWDIHTNMSHNSSSFGQGNSGNLVHCLYISLGMTKIISKEKFNCQFSPLVWFCFKD